MKKYILICSIVLGLATASIAQQFTEMTDIQFMGVGSGDAKWGDYDNDGDLDILLSGNYASKIYRNDGNNTFTEQTQIQLTSVEYSNTAWGDYDNDGDLDILFNGIDNNYNLYSKIYRNNGNNTFNEQTQIQLMGFHVTWGDYDNDGDLDILSSSGGISYIYRNNGNNTFSQQTQIQLSGGRSNWGDYNNDGYLDILAVDGDGCRIYSNNGNNTFALQKQIQITNFNGRASWGDYDNDGDLDFLLAGAYYWGAISNLYRNNGNNTFTEQHLTQLIGKGVSDIKWGDYDNDGDLDILLIGYNFESGRFSKIYRNDGNNTFTEIQQTEIQIIQVDGKGTWGDYDNDGDLDILFNGIDNNYNLVSKIYRNNSTIANTRPTAPSNLTTTVNGNNVTFSWNAATDANQTGKLSYNLYVYKQGDSLYTQSPQALAQTHVQNGKRLVAQIGSIQTTSHTVKYLEGNYTWSVQAIDASMAGGMFAAEKDVYVTPCPLPLSKVSKIVLKNIESYGLTIDSVITSGNSKPDYAVFISTDSNMQVQNNILYTADPEWKNTTSQCVYKGNKTNPQINITNLLYNTTYYIHVYIYTMCNDFLKYDTTAYQISTTTLESEFTKEVSIPLEGVANAKVAWGDYDNDGDLDLYAVSSFSDAYQGDSSQVILYRNNGNNSFTELLRNQIHGSFTGAVQWTDYDNDNDIDASLTGTSSYIWEHWIQNSYPCEKCVTKCEYGPNGWHCWLACGMDICYTNEYVYESVEEPIYKVYKNYNNGNFEANNIPISLNNANISSWGDYDNDGDLDILASKTGIYQNTGNQFVVKHNITGNDWGDYDNDGDLDVLHENVIYQNVGKNFIKIADVGGNVWGDYDNDGDLDVLGSNKVYQNTGSGFVQIANVGGLAWGDYNNDGLLDVLSQHYVYKNDGQGHFIPVRYFESVYGRVDYDNDGRLDVCTKEAGGSIALYRNTTVQANIMPTAPTNLQTTQYGDYVEFTWDAATDANQTGGLSYNLYVYNNDTKTYAKSPQSFAGVNDSLNGKRLLVQRVDIQGTSYELKLPDGNYSWSVQAIDASFAGGEFAPSQNFTFECTAPTDTINKLVFDNITGNSINIQSVTLSSNNANDYVVFINYTNNFTPPADGQTFVADTNWQRMGQQCVYVGNGSQPKINITRLDYQTNYYIRIYTYNNCRKYNSNYYDTVVKTPFEQFTDITDIYTLFGNANGIYNPMLGDYDNDGDLDILLTSDGRELLIYRNDNNNNFTQQVRISTGGHNNRNNTAVWGDYDNDGDLDILLPGLEDSYPVSTIYRNEGYNTFVKQNEIQIIGTTGSSVEWGDYDNDGDLDFLLSGAANSGLICKIYTNNGNNTFTGQIQLASIAANVQWGDYDNDGDLDVLLSGSYSSIGKIYRNNGNNTFTEQTQIQLSGNSSAKWGDYNNDGKLDIVQLDRGICRIYRNNGNNTFTEQEPIQRPNVEDGDVEWGDYDNDGYLDILVTGHKGYPDYIRVSEIYLNNTNNTFTKQTNIQLANLYRNTIQWGDYDNDNDLDVLLFGYKQTLPTTEGVSKIYRNNNTKYNATPNAPTNMQSTINNNNITLTWSAATDANQAGGHSYNVYVRNTDNNKLVVTPMANTTTGKRLVAKMGSIQTTGKTYYLPKGNYAWAVQAIDNSFIGSPFSAEQIFSITTDKEHTDLKFDILPNPANEKLLINVGSPTDFGVQLIGIDGTIFDTQQFTKQSQALLTRLPRQSGLYFVRVITPNGVGTQKVMIQRKD